MRYIGIKHARRFGKDFYSVHLIESGIGTVRLFGNFRKKSKAQRRANEKAVELGLEIRMMN